MFNYLNAILYKTTKNNLGVPEESEFPPYLIQRWCSMYSPSLCFLVNETSNRYWSTLDSKNEWYSMLYSTIPKCSYKKIDYIKKSKKEAEVKEKEYIQKIANNLEISSREVISYVRDNNLKIILPKNQ